MGWEFDRRWRGGADINISPPVSAACLGLGGFPLLRAAVASPEEPGLLLLAAVALLEAVVPAGLLPGGAMAEVAAAAAPWRWLAVSRCLASAAAVSAAFAASSSLPAKQQCTSPVTCACLAHEDLSKQ